MNRLNRLYLKKITALLLLFIFCFIWVGYRFLLSHAEENADKQMEAMLDNHAYDESQLVSIKIPVSHFPAYVNAMGFERMNGQVEYNGLCYNYVKIRIYEDSLELLCIPNRKVISLRKAKNNLFSLVNDIQQKDNRSPGHHFIKLISAYYLLAGYECLAYFLSHPLSIWPEFFNEFSSYSYLRVIENPPEN
jgi:hypothetical protein